MRTKSKFLWIIGAILLVTGLYLFADLKGNLSYALNRRVLKLTAIVLMAVLIGGATLIFQTITSNRILTPSVMGLDSLYLFFQTVLVFLFGGVTLTTMNRHLQFFLSLILMVLFAFVLFRFMFRGGRRNVYFLLLTGIVAGTFFQSLSSFMQVLIDPNEFLIVQDKMFASINNVNAELLLVSWLLTAGLAWSVRKEFRYLDVLRLGRDASLNLGVDYDAHVKRLLVVVVISIAIATALVGPMMFLGLLVVNVTYELFPTYRHRTLLPATIIVSILTLVSGQLLVERIFHFSTTVSVVINFIGGLYFIHLIVKERST